MYIRFFVTCLSPTSNGHIDACTLIGRNKTRIFGAGSKFHLKSIRRLSTKTVDNIIELLNSIIKSCLRLIVLFVLIKN